MPKFDITDAAMRILCLAIAAIAWVFLFNNVLNFWHDWPGLLYYLSHQGWLGMSPLDEPSTPALLTRGFLQLLTYLGAVLLVVSTTRRKASL